MGVLGDRRGKLQVFQSFISSWSCISDYLKISQTLTRSNHITIDIQRLSRNLKPPAVGGTILNEGGKEPVRGTYHWFLAVGQQF